MIAHLKKYIGLYLLAIVACAIYLDTPDDNYPLWLWWLIVPIILWKTPPFNIGDWFWGKITSFLLWITTPLRNWVQTWPAWLRGLFAIITIIVLEEYCLSPLGYTIYPWRMDFGG
tara:strand:+ start:343 stop:687 length:345 start_codon:yes stop_codon:yes gene_type:complete